MKTHNLTHDDREVINDIVAHLFFCELLIMLASIYSLRNEQQLYKEGAEERQYRFAYGREHPVYPTKVSLYSLILVFNSHFAISVIYCQLMESLNFNAFATIPSILSLVNLFIISTILGMRIRVRALDLAASPAEQGSYISWMQIKVCKLTSFYFPCDLSIVFTYTVFCLF